MTYSLLAAARLAALFTALGIFAFLFITNSWQATNIFLVPDLLACLVLVAAALLPPRRAPMALIAAFALTAGVLVSAAASYVVIGQFGIGATSGALLSIVFLGLLLRRQWAA